MNQSEQINELATALAAFQGAVEAVTKEDTNPFFKSKYAGLPAVVKAAAPHLAKHGLSVTQTLGCYEYADEGRRVQINDTLTTMVMHSSGQWISDTTVMHLVKEDPQGHGSAVTYMRRYAYMAVLGLVADEDDDGNAATQAKASHPATRTRPPPQMSPQENGRAAIKTQLLGVCKGDQLLAKRLWAESPLAATDTMTRTEIDLLLSRAKAEVDKEPEPAS